MDKEAEDKERKLKRLDYKRDWPDYTSGKIGLWHSFFGLERPRVDIIVLSFKVIHYISRISTLWPLMVSGDNRLETKKK